MGARETKKAMKVATDFVQQLIDQNFKMASAYLSPEFRELCTPEDLEKQYNSLTEFFDPETTAIDFEEVLESGTTDAGMWIYVSIQGEYEVEAVNVVVNAAGKVNDLEWGRT